MRLASSIYFYTDMWILLNQGQELQALRNTVQSCDISHIPQYLYLVRFLILFPHNDMLQFLSVK